MARRLLLHPLGIKPPPRRFATAPFNLAPTCAGVWLLTTV